MRRVLFALKTTFAGARKHQLKQIKKLKKCDKSANSDELSNECTVCLVDFAKDDLVVPLKCNIDHVFHIECLLNWANHNYTCPICR